MVSSCFDPVMLPSSTLRRCRMRVLGHCGTVPIAVRFVASTSSCQFCLRLPQHVQVIFCSELAALWLQNLLYIDVGRQPMQGVYPRTVEPCLEGSSG